MPMPTITARVVGADGIRAVLMELAARRFKKAARKAINECTKVVLAAAKTLVPKRTGSLKKSLGRKVVARKDGGGYVGIVGPRKDMSAKKRAAAQLAFEQGKRKRAPGGPKYRRTVKYRGREFTVNPVLYAHLVEYGTAPRAAKKKKVQSDGQTVFGARTAGAKPRPFLRPAWDGNKARCEAIIRAALREALRSAAK
jgi:HK97 gp10 family phage protein